MARSAGVARALGVSGSRWVSQAEDTGITDCYQVLLPPLPALGTKAILDKSEHLHV